MEITITNLQAGESHAQTALRKGHLGALERSSMEAVSQETVRMTLIGDIKNL